MACYIATKRVRSGLTLVELFTTLAIVSIVLLLAISAVASFRETARNTTCLNNLREWTIAIHSYETANGLLPPGTIGYESVVDWHDYRVTESGIYWKNKQNSSYSTLLLGFLGLESIKTVDKCLTDTRTDLSSKRRLGKINWFGDIQGFIELSESRIQISECPSDSIPNHSVQFVGGTQPVWIDGVVSFSFLENLKDRLPAEYRGTNYLGCSGVTSGGLSTNVELMRIRGAMSSGEKIGFNTINDGLSNTILIGESIGEIKDYERLAFQPWNVGGLARGRGGLPLNVSRYRDFFGSSEVSSVFGFGSMHPSVVNFAFVDGSTNSISREIDRHVFYNHCAIEDGS